ncbi:MAG: type II toxin-antitoxin system Phd/YefM family antitoxin [Candidatus Poribacteria bacterium]|nr:type II toxin-antitoxin system Phd/YefM family antitoxin [Candidatus Poribacteria bacterium]
MKREISAMEARQNFGELLDQVYYKDDQFIIKRANKPMAVVVSVDAYEEYQRLRRKEFAVIHEIWESVGDAPEEEAQQEIERAIRGVRAQMKP